MIILIGVSIAVAWITIIVSELGYGKDFRHTLADMALALFLLVVGFFFIPVVWFCHRVSQLITYGRRGMHTTELDATLRQQITEWKGRRWDGAAWDSDLW